MQNQLYKLQDGIPFRAGHLRDGNQVLLSRFGSDAIDIRFSRNGEFLGYDRHAVGPETDVPDSAIDAVLNRVGITPGVIRVRAFVLPEYGIEIRDMPEYLQEFLDASEDFPAERASHLKEAVADWVRSGSFVLVWGEDYEINADGEVEST